MQTSERTYSISELAREFGVTPRALRFYEDKGLLSPGRDGVNRVFTHRDRGRLKLILQGKRVGFSLIEIKELLDLYNVDQRVQGQRALIQYRARIVALEQQREDIDVAIEMLQTNIDAIQDMLSKPAPAAAVGVARAFEAEAKKRFEDAR